MGEPSKANDHIALYRYDDLPDTHFRASRSGNWLILCFPETSCKIFLSPEVVKGSVGYRTWKDVGPTDLSKDEETVFSSRV